MKKNIIRNLLILARPERFELPTAWFVAALALSYIYRPINALRQRIVPFAAAGKPRKLLSRLGATWPNGTASSSCIACILALLLSFPAHAWTLYAHLGLAADLRPQRYEGVWQDDRNPYLYHTGPRRLFVPGAMDAVSLGLRSGPLFIEASHLSAIEDGLNGAGLTWVSAGVNVDLWESKP